MAAQYYASITSFDQMYNVAHSGTSGTAGDCLELRMGDGTFTPTRQQVLQGLEILRRHIIQGGAVGDGLDLPPTV